MSDTKNDPWDVATVEVTVRRCEELVLRTGEFYRHVLAADDFYMELVLAAPLKIGRVLRVAVEADEMPFARVKSSR